MIEYAEPDLPEPPSPWRRVYGPALNSSLPDRGFLCGAIVIILVWLLAPDLSHLDLFSNNLAKCVPHIVGYSSIGTLFSPESLIEEAKKHLSGKRNLTF